MTPSHKVVVKTSRNNAGEELQTRPSPREPHKASGHLSQEPVSAPCSVWAVSPFTPRRCCLHTHVSPTTRQCTSKAHGMVTSPPTLCPYLLSLPLPHTPADSLLFLKLPLQGLCISCSHCSSVLPDVHRAHRPSSLSPPGGHGQGQEWLVLCGTDPSRETTCTSALTSYL